MRKSQTITAAVIIRARFQMGTMTDTGLVSISPCCMYVGLRGEQERVMLSSAGELLEMDDGPELQL